MVIYPLSTLRVASPISGIVALAALCALGCGSTNNGNNERPPDPHASKAAKAASTAGPTPSTTPGAAANTEVSTKPKPGATPSGEHTPTFKLGGLEPRTDTSGGAKPAATEGSAPTSRLKRLPIPVGDPNPIGKYPDEARRNRVQGKIRLRLVIDETGAVAKITPLNRLGHGLDTAAQRAVRRLQFKPALDANDKPVKATIVWTFTFKLP